MDYRHPQIKVCGLTQPDEARAVADLGADAIGLVFYPKSPRNVSVKQAAAIAAALPTHVPAVGVVVNPTLERLIQIIEQCGLKTIQLHGAESPRFAADLRKAVDVGIVKVLFTSRAPGLADADTYAVDGYLVECGKGRLPGGNAMTWNWALTEAFARNHPMALAGGLDPDNVVEAITACMPDAIDASSGLESSPGQKDLEKVARFISQVRRTKTLYADRKKKAVAIF